MKKSLFFMPLLAAAMAFTSCTSDEPVAPDNSFGEEYDGQAYMRIRIAMPDNATTRAGETAGTEGTENSSTPTFTNGTAEEQAIKQIGLKFYNADGSFYGYGLPIQDPTVTATTEDGTNIEGKIATAVIVLQINQNAPKPTHVVAYVNCGETWKQAQEPNINDIDNTLPEAYTIYDGTKYFAMTSSNYRYQEATGMTTYLQGYQTPIKPSNFMPSAEEAIKAPNPVDIYVERLAAKVKVNTKENMTPETVTNGGYTLDFTIDGYALGGINHESYLIKNLSQNWNNEVLWTGWNDASKHRCYWSMDINYKYELNNPPALDYVSYNEVRNGLPGYKAGAWMYTSENSMTGFAADQANAGSKTEEMQAAPRAADVELNRYLFQPFAYVIGHYTVKKNGVEVKDKYLYEYANQILPEDVMITYMEQNIGDVIYKKTTTDEGLIDVYTGVNMKDAGFVKIDSYTDDLGHTDASLVCLHLTDKATDEALGEYFVLNPAYEEGKAGAKYIQATQENVKPMLQQSKTQAYGFKYDENCGGTGNAGYLAYFPVLIKHLNTNSTYGESARGYYGVVRNHAYQLTINSIKGLGIGIYNPNVDIIPKDKIKPLFLAATFNILSWRVIDQQVEL